MDKLLKNFPSDLNTKLRIEAAKKDTNIKALIIKILRDFFSPEKKH